jgi:hypothetical protein
MSVVFGQGELGEIIGGRRRYRLTWDDLLWAARMLIGEAGTNASTNEGAAVLWCMASRLVALNSTSYTRLIQAYSQPINPKWMAEGEFCRVGGRFNGTTHCAPNKLERRARYQNTTWEEIPGDVQDLVFRWATGQVDNPIPRATHFAVPRVASRGRGIEGLRAREGQDGQLMLIWDTHGRGEDSLEFTGNAFYTTRRSRTWEDRYVRIYFDSERREASDSNVEAVGQQTRPFGQGGERRQQGNSQAVTLTPPPNDNFERTSLLTSDRTSPPSIQYPYFHADSKYEDPSAQQKLSAKESEAMLMVNADRFYRQVMALKRRTNLEMTQMVPILMITAEDDEGGIVNLNEVIFSVSPHDRSYYDEPDIFPDRPIASLEGFEVTVQEPSVGGITGITMGTLKIVVHNPELITRSHPVGKYIAYMMSQGFVMRIRYGLEGAYDLSEDHRTAFQWREEDFFVSQYNLTIADNKTTNISISVMPATQRLMNQIRLGQSIPVAELGSIKASDIDNIIEQVSAGGSAGNQQSQQTQELRRRLSRFQLQLNSARESPGVGLEARVSGSFGFQLHAALTNREIFNGSDSISPVPVANMVEALQSIQGVLLTRRFQNVIQKNCYRYTHRDLSINAINVGPLLSEIVKPEIDYIFGVVTRNQIEIGEKFSVDERPRKRFEGNSRETVKLVFGNFNSRAGQWANKPISTFPINAETVFGHLRQRRNVGEFSSTVNDFISVVNRLVNEQENYDADTSQGSEEVRLRLEKPRIKYAIYPDPTDETAWVMYVYDDKIPTVRIREALDSLSTDRVPTTAEIKKMLEQNKIPWFEMGEEGAIIKSFNGSTQSDDMLASHNMIMANRQQRTVRDFDAAVSWPVGISREFAASTHMTPQQVIRSVNYVAPIRVSVQSLILPTAYFAGPIFVFFPIRTFSGIYQIQQIRHDIKGSPLTNLNLQINLSVFNQIAL